MTKQRKTLNGVLETMTNLSEVKDPDGLSPEQLQEKADIKREEIREIDPNAFDVCNSGEGSCKSGRCNCDPSPEQPHPIETVGDIKSLSLNEKYALILHQVKQLGPLFFVQVSPDTFELPERDPLNLIWINILTGWQIASTILTQFEQNIVVSEQLEREEEEDDDTVQVSEDSTTDETNTQ